ncbi:MAG TPA: response regulator [Verrucomicrobiae bacterium]|nr:response regulator [Verrucomicrobiae bacterium]
MNLSESTILVAEDDPDAAFLLRRALEKANLKNPVEVVRDGQEAIDYLSNQGAYADRERYHAPVLLLLDLKMPRKSGFEVLEWLRQQPGLKRLIVIVLSSSYQVVDINRVYDLGGNSYLVKPADFDALIRMGRDIGQYWLALNERPDLLSEPVVLPSAKRSACPSEVLS